MAKSNRLIHICIWAAPGNGGKTTLARLAAAECAAKGYRVYYFQEDASAGDLPLLFEHAKKHGYELLNSTLANAGPEDQILLLQALVDEGTDLSNTVMFFDTLKKYNDLMSKGDSRKFFQLLRSLTINGCTIVALGHTNKNKNSDGQLVFEGVGDVRNDVDELYYIDSVKDPLKGIVTLTFRIDKTRCKAVPSTFELELATLVIRALPKVVDVKEIQHRKEQLVKDADAIQAIKQCLLIKEMKKTELINLVVNESGLGRRHIVQVVDRYSSQGSEEADALWVETYVSQNNARVLSLPQRSHPHTDTGGV